MTLLDMDIDLMGAQPALFKLYTQLAFIFPLSELEEGQPSHHRVTSTITAGLDKLADNLPCVAGQVVDANSDSQAAPHYKIRPQGPVPQLVVRDYTGDAETPGLDVMTRKGFPMSMLGEDVWAPCPTLAALGFDPRKSSAASDQPATVMLTQISYIRGGLVLCVNMQHNVCDMMGQAAVLGWLSKACRGERFTEEELELGNRTRVGVVPLIEDDDWTPEFELQNQLFPPPPTGVKEPDAVEPAAPSKCTWMYF